MRFRTPIRMALLPARIAWAIANRRGWIAEPPIGSAPHLSAPALDFWRKAVSRSRVYVEYGAGGSTVEAAALVDHIISVETDARYLAAVERRVLNARGRASFHPLFVDIGWTSQWGQPVATLPTQSRLERWRGYPAAPWVLADQLGITPDFILVDGRFRTASVLESFVRLPDGAECTIMLDDFDLRAVAYKRVLQFAEDVQALQGAIAFRRRADFDRAACQRCLLRAYRDPL